MLLSNLLLFYSICETQTGQIFTSWWKLNTHNEVSKHLPLEDLSYSEILALFLFLIMNNYYKKVGRKLRCGQIIIEN